MRLDFSFLRREREVNLISPFTPDECERRVEKVDYGRSPLTQRWQVWGAARKGRLTLNARGREGEDPCTDLAVDLDECEGGTVITGITHANKAQIDRTVSAGVTLGLAAVGLLWCVLSTLGPWVNLVWLLLPFASVAAVFLVHDASRMRAASQHEAMLLFVTLILEAVPAPATKGQQAGLFEDGK